KYDAIRPPYGSPIGADVFLDPVTEGIKNERGSLSSQFNLFLYLAHVVQPAEPLKAALRVERLIQLVSRHPHLSHYEEVERRIDVSGTRAHNKPFQAE